jgi:hypothetical protein
MRKTLFRSPLDDQVAYLGVIFVHYLVVFHTYMSFGVFWPNNCSRMICSVRAMLYTRFVRRMQARFRANPMHL